MLRNIPHYMSAAIKMPVIIKHNPCYKRVTNCDLHLEMYFSTPLHKPQVSYS